MDKIKIGTINLDWCKKTSETMDIITDIINSQEFDFLIVTENLKSFDFNDRLYYAYHSSSLPSDGVYEYMDYGKLLKGKTPVRVTIYSPYNAIGQHEMMDLKTGVGLSFHIKGLDFALYGSIIGTYGIRYQKEIAQRELDNFKEDIEYLKTINENVIIAGDLNTSFRESEKHTQLAQINSRAELTQYAKIENLRITTSEIPNNIDHIMVSNTIVKDYEIKTSVFLDSETLKDKYHKGVMIELIRKPQG